jgi:hypothetical protein
MGLMGAHDEKAKGRMQKAEGGEQTGFPRGLTSEL